MKKEIIYAVCLIMTPYTASLILTPYAAGAVTVTVGTEALSPTDQLNNESDVRLTQNVREANQEGEFSFEAQSIKVIATNGAVTLRGPVDTAAEREHIDALVKSLPGIKRINNQLQVY